MKKIKYSEFLCLLVLGGFAVGNDVRATVTGQKEAPGREERFYPRHQLGLANILERIYFAEPLFSQTNSFREFCQSKSLGLKNGLMERFNLQYCEADANQHFKFTSKSVFFRVYHPTKHSRQNRRLGNLNPEQFFEILSTAEASKPVIELEISWVPRDPGREILQVYRYLGKATVKPNLQVLRFVIRAETNGTDGRTLDQVPKFLEVYMFQDPGLAGRISSISIRSYLATTKNDHLPTRTTGELEGWIQEYNRDKPVTRGSYCYISVSGFYSTKVVRKCKRRTERLEAAVNNNSFGGNDSFVLVGAFDYAYE